MHAIWFLFVVALSHMFEGSAHVVISTAHMDEYVCSLARALPCFKHNSWSGLDIDILHSTTVSCDLFKTRAFREN